MSTDKYAAHYTRFAPLLSYMGKMLDLQAGNLVLEPGAGEGDLVDQVLALRPGEGCGAGNTPGKIAQIRIDALELNPGTAEYLARKYKDCPQVRVRCSDTLFDERLDAAAMAGGIYDRVIANPPYGAWQSTERRAALKKKYPTDCAKETYSLFLLRALSVLKCGGVMTFLIPDTFLFVRRHKKLRKVLLQETLIREIVLFPARIFPGETFGYARLCVITMEKTDDHERAGANEVCIIRDIASSGAFRQVSQGRIPEGASVFARRQAEFLQNQDHVFWLWKDGKDPRTGRPSLGELADVATGLYTGDNHTYLRVGSRGVKGSARYMIAAPGIIAGPQEWEEEKERLWQGLAPEGIPARGVSREEAHGGEPDPGPDDAGSDAVLVPCEKGTSPQPYARATQDWYVRWDKDAVSAYRSGKKARLQNARFYFRRGIALPMIKSSRVNAVLMENQVFDQATVGIFPKEEKYEKYLLALLNSSVMNEILHILNPTANNSAGYIRMLPVAIPSEKMLRKISSLTEKAICSAREGRREETDRLRKKLDELIGEIYWDSVY